MTQPISMPWSSPAFGELPHRWRGVRMAAFPFTPRPGAVERILPPGMQPADGPGMVTLLSYPQTEFQHPFEEAVVMVPVRVDETLGNYIPYIYVTTDEALIPGPAGEIEIEEITKAQIELIPREQEIGQAQIRCEPSDLDPVADLVPEGEGTMIVMLSDNTIPAGEVLKRIKREVRR